MADEVEGQHGGKIGVAFLRWLDAHPRLPVLIIVGRHTATKVEFSIEDWPELEGSVTEHGLDIAAVKDGDCWDLLLSLDAAPVQHGSEWACSICEAEGRSTRFSSRKALWRDHLFDALGTWIVEKLAPAARIEFHRAGCGSTWARLA